MTWTSLAHQKIPRKSSLSFETDGGHKKAKQEAGTRKAEKVSSNIWKKKTKMSAHMLEVSISSRNGALRLERDAWSMVKRLRQATNSTPPEAKQEPKINLDRNRFIHTHKKKNAFEPNKQAFLRTRKPQKWETSAPLQLTIPGKQLVMTTQIPREITPRQALSTALGCLARNKSSIRTENRMNPRHQR